MSYLKPIAVTLLLVFLGTFKVVADVFGLEKLSGAAAVTNVSPAMKVFTAHKGYETFSSRFHLTATLSDGRQRRFWLTPEVYRRLEGPYNRRNVYGAVLAYGPLLAADSRTRPMWDAVLRRGFCESNAVFRELGIAEHLDDTLQSLKIDYVPRHNNAASTTMEYRCE